MDINTCLAATGPYRDLALYSHLVPALTALILGVFAYLRAQNRLNASLFFSFSLAFVAWLLTDLVVWSSDKYALVTALWAPLDFIEIIFFLLLFALIYAYLYPDKLPSWFGPALLLASAVPFAITVSGGSVLQFYQPQCEMPNNGFLESYKILLEIIVISATLILGILRVVSARNDRREQIRVGLTAFSVFLFMAIFSGSEYIANATHIYEINLYALFSLPLLLLMLSATITNFGTFQLGETEVKVLFYAFLLLAGTQFFFVQDTISFLLAALGFIVFLTLGALLFVVSQREIRQRELIQKQEQELEIINRRQETLLHFISHEIKGYLARNEAGFAAITEGDYGIATKKLKAMAVSALADTRRGVETVMDILDASNLKKGTVAYEKKVFDFSAAVKSVIDSLQPMVQERGILLEYKDSTGGASMIDGDENKLRHNVIRNLIDNSIRYTPSGKIKVELAKIGLTTGESADFVARPADSGPIGPMLRMTVADTGVGISPEDMQKLFTEGGHGTNSIKVNVHSTGFGLFIAKTIVEAHGGSIKAESEGKGKGSIFTVELPAV